jgi:DDE superfamily endonuclease
MSNLGAASQPVFPPSVAVEVKALACQLPRERELPLSRLSLSDIRREVIQQGIVASISKTTVWRWLSQDAIQPWRYRSWMFPRDPNFAERAGPILDLYANSWAGVSLGSADFVLSADEKTSIQARKPEHHCLPVQPHQSMRVQSDYKRLGAWAYLAAWDVHRGKVFGRCEAANGSAPFNRLVDQVMSQPPYCSASRVFWIVDNCSSHRGLKAAERLHRRWPNIVLVHTPVHASWLNQIEIYFSIVQRKVLTPNDFDSLAALEQRLLRFQDYYQQIAKPFQWRFTRNDLANLLAKTPQSTSSREAAA